MLIKISDYGTYEPGSAFRVTVRTKSAVVVEEGTGEDIELEVNDVIGINCRTVPTMVPLNLRPEAKAARDINIGGKRPEKKSS